MKLWFKQHCLPPLGAALIRGLGKSLDLKIKDPTGLLSVENRTPYIFVFWHNRLLMTPYLYERFYPSRTLDAMISRSKDGEMITSIINRFNIIAARGSASKKGALAFRELVRRVREEGCDVGITPDGPRGPRYQFKPGALHLAQLTGCPIVTLTMYFKKKKELKSWDRFQIPYPGTSGELVMGVPHLIPMDASESEIERHRVEIEKELGGD